MESGAPAVVAGPAPALLRAALDASPEAVVLCAADHTILLVNAAARALVPGLEPGGAPPAGLAGAADSFTGEHGGRRLTGLRRQLDDDHYAWYLHEDTTFAAGFLADAGRRLSGSLHRGRCLRITVELAVAHLADAAVVVLPAHRRRCASVRLVGGGTVEEDAFAESRTAEVPGLPEALGGFPPVPSRWLGAGQAPGWLFPADFGPIGALLVIPLPGNAEPAGALILARRGSPAAFRAADEELAGIFAARAGAAISAATLYQDQVATTAILQADLLPPELPRPEGVELAGSCQAAGDAMRIGGDFYDVFGPTEHSDETVIALGDVCGKGPEAAVLTGKVRQTLRALRLVEATPEVMLRVLNRALLQSGRPHRFVTVVVGAISRPEHGRVLLTLATGGHPPPLVLRADGRVEVAPVAGTMIGAVAHTEVRPAAVELAPGEICLLYSDGLTEARGGPSGREQYGEQRLRAALAGCVGMVGTAAVERVRQLVSDWVRGGVWDRTARGAERDDIAMLAVRAPARTPLSLRDGGAPDGSPFAIDARRGERKGRPRP